MKLAWLSWVFQRGLMPSMAGVFVAFFGMFGVVLQTNAQSDAHFGACLNRLETEARTQGLLDSTLETHLRGLEPDPTVLPLLDSQPEFKTDIWDYMAGLVDEERVERGQALMRENAALIADIQARHGVDASAFVAIWGIETDYGQRMGERPILRSLATLSCEGRRQPFFRKQLMAALRIVEEGHVRPETFAGSWAGAFGHTQFMPTTFLERAVDHDGDGRRDLIGSIPDALASTARYLQRSGWQAGQPWSIEVRVPENLNPAWVGRRQKATLQTWAQRGLQTAKGEALVHAGVPLSAQAGLILPAGPKGPAFLTLANFDAFFAYNPAESYALAIGHLSDRLQGGGAFITPWPTDDPPLSRQERRRLQERLIAMGYDIGKPDGIVGSKTRKALQSVQSELGLTPDGRAGLRTLKALEAARTSPAPR
jgi:glucose-6-phosphate 1-epimerase